MFSFPKSNIRLFAVVALSVALSACTETLTEVSTESEQTASTSSTLEPIASSASLETDGAVAKGPSPGNGVLNIVHGVPNVLVDVCASGPATGGSFARIISDFEFTEFETFELPAGLYDANVVAAGDDCLNAIPGLSATDVSLGEGANASVVAHLTETGGLALSLFVNDVVKDGKGTIAAHHTAQAPAVDVWVGRNLNDLSVAVEDFTNGQQVVAPLQPGRRDIALSLPDQTDVIFGPVKLVLKANRFYATYAVGTFPNTFTFVILPIKAH